MKVKITYGAGSTQTEEFFRTEKIAEKELADKGYTVIENTEIPDDFNQASIWTQPLDADENDEWGWDFQKMYENKNYYN